MNLKNKELELEVNYLNEVIDDVQTRLNKLESDYHIKLNENQTMSAELSTVSDQLTSLEKEKKRLGQVNETLMEQVHREENKVNQLNKIRLELQETVASMEECVQKERKDKVELSHKLQNQQAEFKETQLAFERLKNAQSTMEEQLRRKDGEISCLTELNEEREEKLGSLEKQIKSMAESLSEVENQYELEHAAKVKIDKQRKELTLELEELTRRMEGACDATTMQVELNAKYEKDLERARHEMEAMGVQHQKAMASAVRKSQETVAGLVDEMDLLQKEKIK